MYEVQSLLYKYKLQIDGRHYYKFHALRNHSGDN